ncbi:MAG: hypothetical protein WEB30_16720 [Cyclobacteriaceae bacterium]
MKKVMFALCFVFGGIVTLMAQEQQDTTSNQYRTETQSQYPQDAQGLNQDRERIQSIELPDEVKRALEGEEYRGWLVSGAFKAKSASDESMQPDTTSTDPGQPGNEIQPENNNAIGAQDEEVYIVELKNGAETKTIRFDASGQVIEEMEGQTDQNQSESNENSQPDQTETEPPSETEQSPQTETEQSADTESDQTETETQTDQSTKESQTDRP